MFTLLALSLIGCADPQQAPATPPDAPTQPIVEPPSDVTPPSLLDADPADRADSVPTDAIITLWFDEDIDPPSAAASVELRGRDGALPATVRVDGAVVTLTPDAPLPASSTLSLALKPGLADLAGNLTRQGELLTFATEGRVLGPRHVDPATGHTYQVVWASRDITWERAAEVAATMAAGGEEAHLAVIADAEEAAALAPLGDLTGLWLGGEPAPGGWAWVTGEPTRAAEAAARLGAIAPDAHVAVGPDDTLTASARPAPGFLVEIEPPTASTLDTNGHRYLLSGAYDWRWDSAERTAESAWYRGVQGHLVTITGQDEQDLATHMAGAAGAPLWLGAWQDPSAPGYAEPAGGWSWVTGEPFVYTAFNAGEPNEWGQAGEDYLNMWEDGLWNDIADTPGFNSEAFGVLVEFDLSP